MLDGISLTNFKALKSAHLDLGQINVLIGPNGTGKSSVLQVLKLVKQSLGHPGLRTSANLIDLGTFADIIHKRNNKAKLGFGVDFGTEPSVDAMPPWDGPTRQHYEALFGEGGQLDSQELRISAGGQDVNATFDRVGRSRAVPIALTDDNERVLQVVPTAVIGQPLSLGFSGHYSEGEQLALHRIFGAVHPTLAAVFIVPAIRGFEATSYALEPDALTDMFDVRSVEQHASRVLSTIAYRRELEAAISEFSEQVLNLRLRIKLIPGQRVTAEAENGSKTNLVNEGFGANQLMVLLAQLVVAPTGALLGLEEAEIHLHPLAQTKLARVLAELARRDGKQIVLTTHSEHILMGLLTLVATGDIAVDDLHVFYFSKDETTGVASAERLPVDEHGRLLGGMKGFFEANVGELDRYLDALAHQATR
jgi:energy-coupling factor transporter ATP-binding protein EcfA2